MKMSSTLKGILCLQVELYMGNLTALEE